MKFTIDNETSNLRIDKYLSQVTDLSRSKTIHLLENGEILVNNKLVKKNHKTKLDEEIVINYQKTVSLEDIPIIAQNIPIDIIFEDENIAIINKPSGMVVHPSIGHHQDTLVNALLFHFNELSNSAIRPGLVHRIDKDTSGLLVVAKNDQVHEILAEDLKEHKIKREYLAIVHNGFEHQTGKIDAPLTRSKTDRKKYVVGELNSKDAVTNFSVLDNNINNALIKCDLETGRTHQIRVHLNWIKHPIYNDPVYGYKKEEKTSFGQYLHAWKLTLTHPISKDKMQFVADPPKEFCDKLQELSLTIKEENDDKRNKK